MNLSRSMVVVAMGCLFGNVVQAVPGATIESGSVQYDAADHLVAWTFSLNEFGTSTTLTHLVFGFDDGNTYPADVYWDDLANITVSSSTFTATKFDAWPDAGEGKSYLEVVFDTPIVLNGDSATFSFNYLTGGALQLSNPTGFFVSLYSGGDAVKNMTVEGTLVATLTGLSSAATDLSAIPEPASLALGLGVMGLGMGAWRRRRSA